GYTIQVAALGSKATAEDLAKRLRRKGFASHILPLSVPNRGTLYRVRIGGFNTLKEAEKWVGHLKQEEGLSPFIAKDKG
ncbi:MAG TPA: SPOR domain-containing protein, partial [Nitrospiria bacterium]|nr:SPOR domain-containing protein [Nitrospiria bacterium]